MEKKSWAGGNSSTSVIVLVNEADLHVLSRWQKIGKEDDDWMSNGKEFQRTAAATGNECRLTVDRWKGRT